MALIKVNALSYAKMLSALIDDKLSYKGLAKRTGLNYTTVRDYVNAMHKERVVHICGFNRDTINRDNERLWKFGRNRDADRRLLTHAERQHKPRSNREKHSEN
jgi:transcription initiation factor IIE alpha subunit